MQAAADPKESRERNLLIAALFHPITHHAKRRNTAGKVACAPKVSSGVFPRFRH